MAQVQQVSASALNGIPEKNGNGMKLEESSPAVGLMQNGSILLHGTPTKDLNGASTSIEADDLQLSPGDLRRRSTRASALKAQEKIKLKDDIVQGPQKRLGDHEDMESEEAGSGAVAQSAAKKRKLENGRQFDQTCFRFGLRTNDDGDVYAMTDESENSSIHESEMEVVRYHYEKMKNREPDEETLRERLKIKKEAENALRDEEAKLLVLRKMKDSQSRAITKLAAETKAADLAEAAAAVNAYKPVVANGANGKGATNGKNAAALAAQNSKTMAGLASLPLQQQLDLLQKLSSQSPTAKQAYLLAKKNPSQTTQLFSQLIAINNAQVQKQKEAETASNTLAQHQAQQAQITQSKLLLHQQTPAQRIQAARQAFRAQADKQLMTIPTQKTQPHDLTFLPNPNASAFHALLGLDLVVQYVQKDKSVDKFYTGPSYECEECKTDCAHTWKAIGSSQDDLHLYCENCVRSAQKRKNKTDQTSLLKRAFQKISLQEKEFEKKIAEGQLEQNLAPEPKQSIPITPTATTSLAATVSSTPLVPRIPSMPSSSGTSTPTMAMKSSTPLSSTPSKSASSSSAKKAASSQQAQQLLAMQQLMSNPMMRNPAIMQQMMLQMAQMAQMATQGRTVPNMALIMQAAQNQAAVVAAAQAQAQAAQAAQAQAQAQAQAKSSAQQNQAMLLAAALMNQNGGQQLAKLTPQQQKQLYDALKGNRR